MSKNPTQPNQVKTPKLRFPGFDGVWGEKKLDKVLKVIDGDRGSNYPGSTDFYPEGYCLFLNAKNVTKKGFSFDEVSFITKEKDEKLRKGKLERNDIVLTTRGSIGHIAFYNKEISFENIRINSGMVLLRDDKKVTDSNFIFRFLDSKKIQNRIQRISFGSAQPQLTVKEINNLKISFPQLVEQQKIASFLAEVDAWIENLREQKKSLESYKKALMQKIFSQQIRFKDEKGDSFTEWEEKRLGNVCNIKKGVQLNRDGLSSDTGFPVINGGIDPSGYTSVFNTVGNTITISEGGNSCGYVNFIKENFWSGGHCYSLLDLKNSDKFFLYQYLKFIQKNIMRLRVGSGLPNIQKKDIERLKLEIPSLPEQQKIAEFLTSVDKSIESKQQQITEAENWKKGLMQGLFV